MSKVELTGWVGKRFNLEELKEVRRWREYDFSEISPEKEDEVYWGESDWPPRRVLITFEEIP